MLVIVSFFIIHWYASVFAQSFFLHRYMAHRMFTMNPFWERFFYLFTFLAQGSSFLHPKSYAQLHLEHHKHSDTEEDPHSPHFWKDVFSMMVNTGRVYMDFKTGKRESTSPYIERDADLELRRQARKQPFGKTSLLRCLRGHLLGLCP